VRRVVQVKCGYVVMPGHKVISIIAGQNVSKQLQQQSHSVRVIFILLSFALALQIVHHFPRDRTLLASPSGTSSAPKSRGGSGASGGSWRGRERSLITLLDRVRVDAPLVLRLGCRLTAPAWTNGDAGSGRSAGLSRFLTIGGRCWCGWGSC